MIECLFVGLGGFIGAVCRYLAGMAISPAASAFPVSTLLINFAGAFIIGAVTEFSAKIIPVNPHLMLFLTTGICGGFTTFSTFSLETINLFEKGKIPLAFSYAIISVVLCLAGVMLGKLAVRLLARAC